MITIEIVITAVSVCFDWILAGEGEAIIIQLALIGTGQISLIGWHGRRVQWIVCPVLTRFLFGLQMRIDWSARVGLWGNVHVCVCVCV